MIKINLDKITDHHKYKDLALLFDNPKFQEDLKQLKKQIEMDNNCPGLASYLLTSKGSDMAQVLAKKYKYPPGFRKAIFNASRLDRVTNNDVENCYSIVIMHPRSEIDPYTVTLTKDDLVIFISPHTIKGNKTIIIKQIGDEIDNTLKNADPLSPNHPFNLYNKHTKNKSELAHFRTVREWYWRNINGERPHDIALSEIGISEKDYKQAREGIKSFPYSKADWQTKEKYERCLDRLEKMTGNIKRDLRRYRQAFK